MLLGDGAGTFQNPQITPVPEGPWQVAVGDLAGNGIPDLVTVDIQNVDENGTPLPNTVSVLLGNGAGTFRAPVDHPVGAAPLDLVVGDFHGNGILDVAVTNALSNTVSVLRGNG